MGFPGNCEEVLECFCGDLANESKSTALIETGQKDIHDFSSIPATFHEMAHKSKHFPLAVLLLEPTKRASVMKVASELNFLEILLRKRFL